MQFEGKEEKKKAGIRGWKEGDTACIFAGGKIGEAISYLGVKGKAGS